MSSNLFGNSDEIKQKQFQETVDTHSKAILTVVERQKDIENSLDTINEKIELLDHNAIDNFKKIFQQIKEIKNDVKEIKSEIKNVKDFESKMVKQIKIMASHDEVAKLERYIDLWEPLNFITRDEITKIKKEIINDLEKIIEGFLNK